MKKPSQAERPFGYKNDVLEFDFKVAIRIGFAGMDVAEFIISKAKEHTVCQIDIAGNEFYAAKAAFAASAANVHADSHSF